MVVEENSGKYCESFGKIVLHFFLLEKKIFDENVIEMQVVRIGG